MIRRHNIIIHCLRCDVIRADRLVARGANQGLYCWPRPTFMDVVTDEINGEYLAYATDVFRMQWLPLIAKIT